MVHRSTYRTACAVRSGDGTRKLQTRPNQCDVSARKSYRIVLDETFPNEPSPQILQHGLEDGGTRAMDPNACACVYVYAQCSCEKITSGKPTRVRNHIVWNPKANSGFIGAVSSNSEEQVGISVAVTWLPACTRTLGIWDGAGVPVQLKVLQCRRKYKVTFSETHSRVHHANHGQVIFIYYYRKEGHHPHKRQRQRHFSLLSSNGGYAFASTYTCKSRRDHPCRTCVLSLHHSFAIMMERHALSKRVGVGTDCHCYACDCINRPDLVCVLCSPAMARASSS